MAGMGEILKAAVRKAANMLGYDIVAFDGKNNRWRLARLLQRHGVTAIFDVGANRGHFGWDMRELGFAGKIVSFEPLSEAFAQLQRASAGDPSWQAVPIGLGERDEEQLIHVAGNSQSSSFLPMLDTHRQAAPESAYRTDERATIRRLDGMFADYCSPQDRVFLKIDTQGFERKVVEGARGILAAVPLIQLECSLVPLYDGADLIEALIGRMRDLGYDPVDLQPTFHHQGSAHLMQADILFVRRAADNCSAPGPSI
jgi:FkbM family methyltransferase